MANKEKSNWRIDAGLIYYENDVVGRLDPDLHSERERELKDDIEYYTPSVDSVALRKQFDQDICKAAKAGLVSVEEANEVFEKHIK